MDTVLFNLCWFANAYGARYQNVWIGPTVVGLSLFVHLLIVNSPRREGVFVMVVAILGYLMDSSFQRVGVLEFNTQGPLELAPSWLFLQWGAFALLFNRALNWLRTRPYQACLLGFLGGPASYYGASNLGVLRFGEPFGASLAIFATTWGLLLPLLLRFSDSFSSHSAERTVA